VANTDNALLKFKFAHLNSVDFKLEVVPTPSGHVSMYCICVTAAVQPVVVEYASGLIMTILSSDCI
jgi:hypothetical protein